MPVLEKPQPHVAPSAPARAGGLEGMSPASAALALSHLPGLVWLDSAMPGAGRFSLVTAAPERVLTGCIDRDWAEVEFVLADRGKGRGTGGLFPGAGLFGFVGYDGRFVLGVYPRALVFDHELGRWIDDGGLAEALRPVRAPAPASAPRFRQMVDRVRFEEMVARAREFIAAGDIYQVNLSHSWRADLNGGGPLEELGLYLRLREISPAPFAAFLDLGGQKVLSSSPELFLEMSERRVLTRPIKGTRRRHPGDAALDERAAAELLNSEKERAELLMITDLERNDLGRVCEFGSVRVEGLWEVEAYAQVFHLVSTVSGALRPEVSHPAAFAECFPGGSITGAPKKRAREIIAELEPHPRGIYTGAIGGFGFNGESRWSIAIRTAVCSGGGISFHSGAGIVADSDPASEYEETLHKAAGLLELGSPARDPDSRPARVT